MKHPITLRIDPELLAKAKSVARGENRTLTNFIETLLIQRIATVAAEPRSKGRADNNLDRHAVLEPKMNTRGGAQSDN